MDRALQNSLVHLGHWRDVWDRRSRWSHKAVHALQILWCQLSSLGSLATPKFACHLSACTAAFGQSWLPLSSSSMLSWNRSGEGWKTKSLRSLHRCPNAVMWRTKDESRQILYLEYKNTVHLSNQELKSVYDVLVMIFWPRTIQNWQNEGLQWDTVATFVINRWFESVFQPSLCKIICRPCANKQIAGVKVACCSFKLNRTDLFGIRLAQDVNAICIGSLWLRSVWKMSAKSGVSGTSGLFIRWTFRHLGEASGHRQVESWNSWTVGQVDDLVLGNVLGLIENCWKKLGEFRSSKAPPRFDCQSPCQSISIQINPSRWFQLNSSRPFLKFPATGGTGAAGAGFGAFGDDGLTCTINIINIAIPQAARASNPISLWAAPSDLALPDIPQTWKLCSHQSQRDT